MSWKPRELSHCSLLIARCWSHCSLLVASARIIRARMANRTERDFAPEPSSPRRRFMIAGEHVILRAFEREDAERCYRWMNDPNIVRTLKSRYPIAFENETEWIDKAMHASSGERHFAIERKDDR